MMEGRIGLTRPFLNHSFREDNNNPQLYYEQRGRPHDGKSNHQPQPPPLDCFDPFLQHQS
jgi:hypothetical protein